MGGRRVAIYGTGRTAGCLVRELEHSPHVLAAALDHVAERVGRDLGTLTTGDPIGVSVTDDFDAALCSGAFDLVAYVGLAGERHIEVMTACIEAGVDMAHTCFTHPQLALEDELHGRLAERAAATGSRIVGTGVTPGLWLDVLPALLSSAAAAPVSVHARQLSEISGWGRGVLRDEMGVGTTRIGVPARADLGLSEPAHMLAEALNLTGYTVESRSRLVVAEEAITVGDIEVSPGQIEGARLELAVIADGQERVRLEWIALANVFSRISASGEARPLEIRLKGGDGSEMEVLITPPPDPYPGTGARLIQAITAMGTLAPGLYAPTALPVA